MKQAVFLCTSALMSSEALKIKNSVFIMMVLRPNQLKVNHFIYDNNIEGNTVCV